MPPPPRAWFTLRRVATLLVAVVTIVTIGVGSAAADPTAIAGTWNFEGGQVLVQQETADTFQGVVVSPTTFSSCSHPVGTVIWEIQGNGLSYTGTHTWFRADCSPNPGGESTWKILNTDPAEYVMSFCTASPGSGPPNPAAAPNHPVGSTLCYELTRALAPVPLSRCPRATGRLRGRRLGQVRLGMTRRQARQAFKGSLRTPVKSGDLFCLTPTGVRVGYASTRLLTTLSSAARKRGRGRVVVAVTANPFYAVGGVRPGDTLFTAEHRLRLGVPFRIGPNYWYMASDGVSTAVLEARFGYIETVGIATKRLTDSRSAEYRLITSFF